MSKIASLQAGLSRAASRTQPGPPPAVSPAPSEPAGQEEQHRPSAKAPSREGKVHVGAYLPPGFKSSLRLVQAQTGEDTQTVIARALNELFRGHNVPVVDHN